MSEKKDADKNSAGAPKAATEPEPSKTPMYEAAHAARYQRQEAIRAIQESTGRTLICHVTGSRTQIDRDDILGFVDMLHNVTSNEPLDLLLHTGGGDVDAAEKLIQVVRQTVGTAELRVIVPDFAKSAGTLMALGAEKILMSDTSELGPIDPQILRDDGSCNVIMHSVQSYLDAYETHAEALKTDPSNMASRIMLSKLDPGTVKLFESIRDRARSFAEKALRSGMFRSTSGNFTKIASDLIDTKRWPSHGQPIFWQDAIDLGLAVEYLTVMSEAWQAYWRLYCLQRLAIKDSQKLYESEYASLIMDA